MAQDAQKSRLESVTVYCGSSPGRLPAYAAAARSLGEILANQNIRLVWGGGDLGLMGEISRTVIRGGGNVLGFIPEFLTKKERCSPSANVTLTPDMHARKWSMFDNGDGIAVLPGGIGTLEEFFEMLTWNQIGIHNKPMVVLNLNGIWDPLFELLSHLQAEGFIPDRIKYDCLHQVEDVGDIIPTMRRHLQTHNVVPIRVAG